MAYLIGLIAAIAVFWLGLSGHFDFPILYFGIFALVATVWFTIRLGILDRESSPYYRIFPLIAYWVWLMGEVIKANLVVIRAAVAAVPDIEPAVVKVKTRCKSDLARVIFANSITLTPGTVTIDVDGDELLVHALYKSEAAPGAFDEMDRRSSEAVDGKG